MTPTSAQRKQLRAQAHLLQPVVMLGGNGLTEAVLKEIDRSLLSHELVKVRVSLENRQAREEVFAAICTQLDATSVQSIGKILVVYRANPEKLPRPLPGAATARSRKKEPRRPKKLFQDR